NAMLYIAENAGSVEARPARTLRLEEKTSQTSNEGERCLRRIVEDFRRIAPRCDKLDARF
ncbi:MAG: hypothetical protein IKW13_09130, partial [Thermoguttaceae bacterium]|nr:hypothetical protein [Thermoguttaceae bacterium]